MIARNTFLVDLYRLFEAITNDDQPLLLTKGIYQSLTWQHEKIRDGARDMLPYGIRLQFGGGISPKFSGTCPRRERDTCIHRLVNPAQHRHPQEC